MIDFMKYKWIYFGISGTLIAISIASLIIWGLKPSIDFVGGSLLELSFDDNGYNKLDPEKLKNKIQEVKDVSVSSVQPEKGAKSYAVRLKDIDENKKNEIVSKLNADVGRTKVQKFETVGPTLGRELLIKTIVGIVLASLFIMFYVARQFKDRIYGVSAILAMIHDTVILLGTFSIMGKFMNVEVDTLFVTAVLTTLSFSVHDTIIVFDRVRERIRAKPNESFYSTINSAVSQTLVRSFNNSIIIIFMLTAMVVLGGSTIKWFSLALLIGTVSGTYSSPFVAVPLLLMFSQKKKK